MPLKLRSISTHSNPFVSSRGFGSVQLKSAVSSYDQIGFTPQIQSHVGFDTLKEYIQLFGNIKPPHIAKPLTDSNDWIIFDGNYLYYRDVKNKVDSQIQSEAFATLPDTENASLEILDLIVKQYPDYFEREQHIVTNKIAGEKWDLRDNYPLRVIGMLLPNDLLLTRKIGDKYVLVAGSVHLPSKWSLTDKIGKNLAGVHYEEKDGAIHGFGVYKHALEKKVDSYFDLMPTGKLSIRFVPMVHPEPEISQHPSLYVNPNTETYHSHNVGDKLWIRTERETFRKLHRNNDFILMTIHPFYAPLSLVEERPALAKNLLDFHLLMDEDYRNYRADLKRFYDPLVEYLKMHSQNVA